MFKLDLISAEINLTSMCQLKVIMHLYWSNIDLKIDIPYLLPLPYLYAN